MSEPVAPIENSSRRSGCALTMGILLIATGVMFLAQNLFDYSLFRFFRIAVIAFADYWPVVLLVWGGYKIYQRVSDPSGARASAFEVVLLIFIIVSGLTLRVARRALNEVSTEMGFDRMAELAGVPVLGAAHRFSSEEEFDLGASDVLHVVNPRGSVKIEGVAAQDGVGSSSVRVLVRKRVYAESETEASAIAESVATEFEGSGRQARLTVAHPGEADEEAPVEVDLEIRLPKRAGVTVENPHGRVSVFDLAGPVAIETARENIEASNLTGGLRAETRHGDIRVAGISGTVELLTRDGSITATKVDGDLRAEANHGSIRAEDVSGRAVFDNRHADVRASRIKGPIEMTGQNSDISIETAGSSVSIKNSHAPIFVREVAGALTIEARNSAIQARDIEGDVSIDDQDEAVTLVAARGSVRLRAPRSRVTVEEIEGPLEIESSHDDVRVTDFGSSLTVRSTHAALEVETARLSGNMNLSTSYGDVRFRFPPGTPMSFRGQTEDGELHSEVSGLDFREETRDGGSAWTGVVGGGGHQVLVVTSFGDIVLEALEP